MLNGNRSGLSIDRSGRCNVVVRLHQVRAATSARTFKEVHARLTWATLKEYGELATRGRN